MGDRVDDHGMVHSCEWTDAYGNTWVFPDTIRIAEFGLSQEENEELKRIFLSYMSEDDTCALMLELMAGDFFVINARAMKALMHATARVARTSAAS